MEAAKVETVSTIQMADNVVASIAGLAALEVDGVSGLVSGVKGALRRMGMRNANAGVKIDIDGRKVRVALAVVVSYGYNVVTVSRAVQAKVRSSIENMTGLEVTGVSVRVADVDMSAVSLQ